VLFGKGVKISQKTRENIKRYIKNTLDDVVISFEKELEKENINISESFSVLFLNEFLGYMWRDLYLEPKEERNTTLLNSLERIYNHIYDEELIGDLDFDNKIIKGKFEFILGKYEKAMKTLEDVISSGNKEVMVDLDLLSTYEMYSLILFNRGRKEDAIKFYKEKVIAIDPLDKTSWEILQEMLDSVNSNESKMASMIIDSLDNPIKLAELSLYVNESEIVKLFFDKYRTKLSNIISSDIRTTLETTKSIYDKLIDKINRIETTTSVVDNHRYLLQQAIEIKLRLALEDNLMKTQMHFLNLVDKSKEAPFILYELMNKYFEIRDVLIKKERYLGYRFTKITHENIDNSDVDYLKKLSTRELISEGYFNYVIEYRNERYSDVAKRELEILKKQGRNILDETHEYIERYNQLKDMLENRDSSIIGEKDE
jgi:tetratricopeptide (TPR) repeat protein